MRTRLDAIVDLTMKLPYGATSLLVHEFAATWQCHVLRMGTDSPLVTMAIPFVWFKKMFHCTPKAQQLAVPKEIQKFIESIEVQGVRIIELTRYATEDT